MNEVNAFTLAGMSFLAGVVLGGFIVGAITVIILMTNIL